MLLLRYHHQRPCVETGSIRAGLNYSTANTNTFGYFEKYSSPRPISTSQLKTLLSVHFWPINLMVYKGSYCVNHMRDLILEQVSRLDAFSVYLFRGSLNSHALGRTTVTREPRPFRSSRTRNRFPQISYAHTG